TDSATLAAVRTDRLLNIWVAPSGDMNRAKQITSGAEREDGMNGLEWTPEGTGNKQLSVNARNNGFLSVSPDGPYIVWVADRTGIGHVWRMDIDGGNP